MIVEDEPDISTPVKEVLERNGYRVVIAVSAEDCLKKVRAGENPDLILMDIIMPGTPVRKVVPKLGKIKIAYLSAVRISEAEKADLMRNKNIVGFIQKPFVLSELLKRVNKLVG